MMGTDGAWGTGMGIGMWVFWIVLVVIVIALVKVLGTGDRPPATPADKTSLEILKLRFARGEIDQEEFERRRRELEK